MTMPYIPDSIFKKIIRMSIDERIIKKQKLLARRIAWEIDIIYIDDSYEDDAIYKFNINQMKQDRKCHRECIELKNKILGEEYKMP